MAYGIKYRVQYKRRSNSTTTIDILKNGWVGGITSLTGDKNPFEISFQGDVNNIYCGTIGTGAVIRVIASPLTLTEFFTANPQDFKVQVWNGASGSNMVWQGFVSSEIYTEDYSSSLPVPIEIQCNDGMQVLDNTLYQVTGTTTGTTYFTGTVILATVMYNIMSKLNLTFNNVYTSNDLRIADYTTNPFLALKIAQENFVDESGVPMSCRQVLNSVFSSLGLVMKFKADSIYLIDPINLHTPSKGKWYGIIGSYPYYGYNETQSSFGGYLDIPSQLKWYETGMNLDIVPQVPEVQVKYNPYNFSDYTFDFNKKENWSISPTFSYAFAYGYYYRSTDVRFNGWVATSNNLMTAQKENSNDQPIFGLQLLNYGTGTTVSYTVPFSNVTQDQNLGIKISIDAWVQTKNNTVNIFCSGTTTQINQIQIPITVKVGNQYWQGGNSWQSGFTSSSAIQPLTVRQTGVSSTNFALSTINDTWTTGTAIIPLIQSSQKNLISGNIMVKIYDNFKTVFSNQIKPWTNANYVYNVFLKNVRVELIDLNTGQNVGNDGINTKVVVSANLNGKKTFEIPLTTGTGTYGCSRGALKTDQQTIAGTNIQGLVRSTANTGGTYYNTSKLLLQTFISQYKQPRYKLTGNIDVTSQLNTLDNYLIKNSSYLGSKAFYVLSGNYNDELESMAVEMFEITDIRDSL